MSSANDIKTNRKSSLQTVFMCYQATATSRHCSAAADISTSCIMLLNYTTDGFAMFDFCTLACALEREVSQENARVAVYLG